MQSKAMVESLSLSSTQQCLKSIRREYKQGSQHPGLFASILGTMLLGFAFDFWTDARHGDV